MDCLRACAYAPPSSCSSVPHAWATATGNVVTTLARVDATQLRLLADRPPAGHSGRAFRAPTSAGMDASGAAKFARPTEPARPQRGKIHRRRCRQPCAKPRSAI